MTGVRYYPLICTNTDGRECAAMTPTDNERTVRERHRMWLTEIVEDRFRLGARDKLSVSAVKALRPHCPRCGDALKIVSQIPRERPYPLYLCEKCANLR